MLAAFGLLTELIFIWMASLIKRIGAYGEPKTLCCSPIVPEPEKSNGLGRYYFQKTHWPIFQIRNAYCITLYGHSR